MNLTINGEARESACTVYGFSEEDADAARRVREAPPGDDAALTRLCERTPDPYVEGYVEVPRWARRMSPFRLSVRATLTHSPAVWIPAYAGTRWRH